MIASKLWGHLIFYTNCFNGSLSKIKNNLYGSSLKGVMFSLQFLLQNIYFLRSITGGGQKTKKKQKPRKSGNQKTKKFAHPKKQPRKGTNLKKIESKGKRRSSRSIDNSAMQDWQTNWQKFTQKKKSSATYAAQTKKSRKTFF